MALYPPPPTTRVDPAKLLIVPLLPGCQLFRVYDPQSTYKPGPRTFRYNGPRLRFDHQREVGRKPANDPERGIYYAAFDLEGGIVEVFGDRPRIIERGTFRVVRSRLKRELRVLDLRNHGAMLAGIAAGISGTENRPLTHSWARYFYENRRVYGSVDGLLYANSHNGKDALALFERAEAAIAESTQKVRRLAAPDLEPELLRIADRNGLILV